MKNGRKPLAAIVLVNKEKRLQIPIEFLDREFVKYQIPKDYVYLKKYQNKRG
jgi:fatty-acyl-CoA synthase